MKWKYPPIIKIYEALGTVADNRIEISGNAAKVFSSSRNKFYSVSYDPKTNALMANDNGSYWRGYLGYPGIAYLLKIGILEYKPEFGNLLKGILWKDINQEFKNDFDKTFAHIFSSISPEKIDSLKRYVAEICIGIEKLDLNQLGERVLPPEGY